MGFTKLTLTRIRQVCTLSNIALFFSMITVEPSLFLFSAANEIMGLARLNGLYWKICEQEYGSIAGVNCLDKVHGMQPYMREKVQTEVTKWGLYVSLSHLIPVAIIAPVYGAFSDKRGRKTVILLTTMGKWRNLSRSQVNASWKPSFRCNFDVSFKFIFDAISKFFVNLVDSIYFGKNAKWRIQERNSKIYRQSDRV